MGNDGRSERRVVHWRIWATLFPEKQTQYPVDPRRSGAIIISSVHCDGSVTASAHRMCPIAIYSIWKNVNKPAKRENVMRLVVG